MDSPTAPSGSHGKMAPEFGHGGAREHSGGAREHSGGVRENAGGARAGAGRPRHDAPQPVAAASSEPRWHAFATHPSAERLAGSELTRAGYLGYAPLIADKVQDPVLRSLFHKVLNPRFKGYGFVFLDPADPWQPVREIAGIRELILGSNGRPAPIATIEILRCQADDAKLCDLRRETLTPLRPGTRVAIDDGAFAGHAGVVEHCNGMTTMVMVELFGRLVPGRFDRASVTELAETPAAA